MSQLASFSFLDIDFISALTTGSQFVSFAHKREQERD